MSTSIVIELGEQGVQKKKSLVRQQLPSHEGEGQGWGM